MTIRQLNELAPADHKIYIEWSGLCRELDRHDTLELHAYGDYKIAKILAIEENKIEADLQAQPVKE